MIVLRKFVKETKACALINTVGIIMLLVTVESVYIIDHHGPKIVIDKKMAALKRCLMYVWRVFFASWILN